VKGPQVRVLAGRWKGRRLDGGAAARPTSSRARLALFNILGERAAGARVLDLYAGTGAVGIEAVSRGAANAVLVDTDAASLRRSIERLAAAPGQLAVVEGPVRAAVEDLVRHGERFDLVFADPPYALDPGGGELDGCAALLGAGGVFILQQDEGLAEPPLPGLVAVSRRRYGRNVFCFYGMR
jgi:16S rRNA (guanine(966)-N(2))-methyltransferase RsmD